MIIYWLVVCFSSIQRLYSTEGFAMASNNELIEGIVY